MYCFSISCTSFSASEMISPFWVGISMSSTAMERPALVAMAKPAYISLSAKITVSRRPQRRKLALIKREISFFFNALLMSSKDSPGGRISDSNARPTVVS
ncbi:hypothetical protein D3C83_48120 [compost metagenome]